MKKTAIGIAILLAAVALAFIFPPERDVITAIAISAPPSKVWAVLTNTGAYPEWNPNMVLKGDLVPGNVIEHDEGHGAERMVFHPTVVVVEPDHALAWLGHIGAPRIMDALHYFQLAPVNGGTLFTQGEHLRGVALWLFDSKQLLPDFKAMNQALKTRAER
jgi:hypothetical protein